MENTSFYISFFAGLLSFFSPCIFPLFPIYLSTLGLNKNNHEYNAPILINTLIFILSFSLVFVLLAMTSTSLGLFFNLNKIFLIKIAGCLIIFFGVLTLGFLKNLSLNRNYMPKLISNNQNLKPLLLGLSFGLAWTPCIGPVLGSILAYSATDKNIQYSLLMLLFYSLGLGLPFFIGSIGYSKILKKISLKSKIFQFYNYLMGILLILFGIIVFNNKIYILNLYFQKLFTKIDNFF